MSATADLLNRGMHAHRNGNLGEAEGLYREAVTADPTSADAWNLIGLLAYQQGELTGAAEHLEYATKLRNSDASIYINLGAAQHALKRFDEAIDSYRAALRLEPSRADAHNNLGNSLAALGRFDDADASFRRAIEIDPNYTKAVINRAKTRQSAGAYEDAIAAYRQALELGAELPAVHFWMAECLENAGRRDDALAAYRTYLRHDPESAEAVYNIGVIELDRYRLAEAARTFQAAIERSPQFTQAHNNLGIAMLAQGRVAEAVSSFRAAVEIQHDDVTASSNYLMAQQYLPVASDAVLFNEHRRWAAVHERPEPVQFRQTPDRQRPLHIGYVSADFRAHAVSNFIQPILRHHRPEQCRVTCYSDVRHPDGTTEELKTLADEWRESSGMPDQDFVNLVRRDAVDILVDLSGHTAGNRLVAFGRRAAPVQVSYLGYGNTTGLENMDYRITDQFADPEEGSSLYAETLVRHPLGFACYAPPSDAPPVTAPPVIETGCLTFGSFNNLAKISPPTVRLWTDLLLSVPGSRLLLKSQSFLDAEVVVDWQRIFADAGLPPERLVLQGRSPSLREHLGAYRQIDIALDTFPYNGSTTTCEALWMGVPVVTLRGSNYVGRMTSALLQWMSLPELIGESPAEYLNIAQRLAANSDRLAEYRNGLRLRMAAAPICDGAAYTRSLEDKFREMWSRWCAAQANTHSGLTQPRQIA